MSGSVLHEMANPPVGNAEGIRPSRHEVERQLDRLLADDVIASNPNSAKVLKYIVERALDGHQVAELDLLHEVFRKPLDVEDTTARVTMDRLRKLLKDYYQGDGQYDPVAIALPDPKKTAAGKRIKFNPGEAYTPSFTYNPSSWIAKELAVAFHLLRGGPAQIAKALEHFANVERAEPDHPEGTLGLIEAWGTILMIGGTPDPDGALSSALIGMLDETEKANGASWYTHGLRALLHTFRGDIKKAKSEFAKALKLNRQATIRWGWYVNFLFRTGKEEQALRLMALESEERADHAPMYALHGVYLTSAHRHEEAERAFAKSLLLDRNCWVAHYGMTKMYQELGNEKKAKEHAKRLETLVEPLEFEDMKWRLDTQTRGRDR